MKEDVAELIYVVLTNLHKDNGGSSAGPQKLIEKCRLKETGNMNGTRFLKQP